MKKLRKIRWVCFLFLPLLGCDPAGSIAKLSERQALDAARLGFFQHCVNQKIPHCCDYKITNVRYADEHWTLNFFDELSGEKVGMMVSDYGHVNFTGTDPGKTNTITEKEAIDMAYSKLYCHADGSDSCDSYKLKSVDFRDRHWTVVYESEQQNDKYIVNVSIYGQGRVQHLATTGIAD